MGFKVTIDQEFYVETCINCGVRFAMTEELHAEKQRNRGPNNPFFCPNGHSQHYVGKSDAQKLLEARQEHERILAQKNAYIERVRQAADAAERRARAAKGQVTKIKRRVGNGVCPCCNRTFANLLAHMHKEHPEFKAEEVAV